MGAPIAELTFFRWKVLRVKGRFHSLPDGNNLLFSCYQIVLSGGIFQNSSVT